MFDLNKIVRKNIQALQPYSSARDEFSGDANIFLDANENPFGNLNRYPDPYQNKLKEILSKIKNISANNMCIGNGSDELIDLAFRIFCNPGKDKVITFSPSYGMYQVLANINDVAVIDILLNENFQINIDALEKFYEEENIKMLLICSPNNPTGNNIDDIEKIIINFKGIVIVDEAYIDFSHKSSLLNKVAKYPNLIVLQTLSKAWALAAARVGIAFAQSSIISLFNKVKPPYNISSINEAAAIASLNNFKQFEVTKKILYQQKKIVIDALSKLSFVIKIFPSDANFLLIKTTDATSLYQYLLSKKIIVRNRHSIIENCIRISIGTAEENKKLIEALKQF